MKVQEQKRNEEEDSTMGMTMMGVVGSTSVLRRMGEEAV
jgi:hypothetical protein